LARKTNPDLFLKNYGINFFLYFLAGKFKNVKLKTTVTPPGEKLWNDYDGGSPSGFIWRKKRRWRQLLSDFGTIFYRNVK
jgi:hypothetical protein